MEDSKLKQENIDESLIKDIAANVVDFSSEKTNFSDTQISQIVKDYLSGDEKTKQSIQKLFPGIENIYKHINEHKETTTNIDPIKIAYDYMNGDEITRKAIETNNPNIKKIYEFVQEYKAEEFHKPSGEYSKDRRNEGHRELKNPEKFKKRIEKLQLTPDDKNIFLAMMADINKGSFDVETSAILVNTLFAGRVENERELMKKMSDGIVSLEKVNNPDKGYQETIKNIPLTIVENIKEINTTREEKIEYYAWFEAVPKIQNEIASTTSEAKALRAINAKINLKNLNFSEDGIQQVSIKDLHKYVSLPEIEKISDESKEYILSNLKAILNAYLKTFPNPQYRQNYISLQGMEGNILYELDVLDIYEELQKQKEKFIHGSLNLSLIQKKRGGKFAKALTYLRSMLEPSDKEKTITNRTRNSNTFKFLETFYKNNKNIAESSHEYFMINFYQLFVMDKLTTENVFDPKTKAITEANTNKVYDEKSFLFTVFGQELVQESKAYNEQMKEMKKQIELMNLNNKAQKDYDLAVQCTKYGESGFWGNHYFYPPGSKGTELTYLQGSGGITRVAKNQEEKNDFYERYGQVAPQIYRHRGKEVCEKYNKELLAKIVPGLKNINIKDVNAVKEFLKKHLPASYFEEGKPFFSNWNISKKIPAPIFVSDGQEIFGRRETPVIRDFSNFDTNKTANENVTNIQIDKPTEDIINSLDDMIIEFKKDRLKGTMGLLSIVVGGSLSRYGGGLVSRTLLFELGRRGFKTYTDVGIDFARERVSTGDEEKAHIKARNTLKTVSNIYAINEETGELALEDGKPYLKPIHEIIGGESIDFLKSLGMFWVLGKTGNLIKAEGNPRKYFTSKTTVSAGSLTAYDALANPIAEGMKTSLYTLSSTEGLTKLLETRSNNKPTTLVSSFIYNMGFVTLLDASGMPKILNAIKANNTIKAVAENIKKNNQELYDLLQKNQRFITEDGSLVDRLNEKDICTDFERIKELNQVIETDVAELTKHIDKINKSNHNNKKTVEKKETEIENKTNSIVGPENRGTRSELLDRFGIRDGQEVRDVVANLNTSDLISPETKSMMTRMLSPLGFIDVRIGIEEKNSERTGSVGAATLPDGRTIYKIFVSKGLNIQELTESIIHETFHVILFESLSLGGLQGKIDKIAGEQTLLGDLVKKLFTNKSDYHTKNLQKIYEIVRDIYNNTDAFSEFKNQQNRDGSQGDKVLKKYLSGEIDIYGLDEFVIHILTEGKYEKAINDNIAIENLKKDSALKTDIEKANIQTTTDLIKQQILGIIKVNIEPTKLKTIETQISEVITYCEAMARTKSNNKEEYDAIKAKIMSNDRTFWKSDFSFIEIIENSLKTGKERTDGIIRELKISSGIEFTIEDINLDIINEIHELGGLFEARDNEFKLTFLKSFLFTESGIAKVEKNAEEKDLSADKTISDAAKLLMRAGYEGKIDKNYGFIDPQDLRNYMTSTRLKGGQTIWQKYFANVINRIGGNQGETGSSKLLKAFNNFRENYFWKEGKDFDKAFDEFVNNRYTTYEPAFKKGLKELFGVLLQKPESFSNDKQRDKLNVLVSNTKDLSNTLGLPADTEIIGPTDGLREGDKITFKRNNNELRLTYQKDNSIFINKLRIDKQQQLQGTKLFNKLVDFCQKNGITSIRLTDINKQLVWFKFGFELSDSQYHDGNMALNYLFNRKYKFEKYISNKHVVDIKKSVDEILKEFGIEHSSINSPEDLVALGDKGKQIYNRIKKSRKGSELEYDVSKGPYIKKAESDGSITDALTNKVFLSNRNDIIDILKLPKETEVTSISEIVEEGDLLTVRWQGNELVLSHNDGSLWIRNIEIKEQQGGTGTKIFNNLVKFCQSKGIKKIELIDENEVMVRPKFGFELTDNKHFEANLALKYLFDENFTSIHQRFEELKQYIDKIKSMYNFNTGKPGSQKVESLVDLMNAKNGIRAYRLIRGERLGTELEYDVNKGPYIKIESEPETPKVLLENVNDIKGILGLPKDTKLIPEDQQFKKGDTIKLTRGNGENILNLKYNENSDLSIEMISIAKQQGGLGTQIFNNIVGLCANKGISKIILIDRNETGVWGKFGFDLSKNDDLKGNIALHYLFNKDYYKTTDETIEYIKTDIDELKKMYKIKDGEVKNIQDLLNRPNGLEIYNAIRVKYVGIDLEYDVAKGPYLKEQRAPETFIEQTENLIWPLGLPTNTYVIGPVGLQKGEKTTLLRGGEKINGPIPGEKTDENLLTIEYTEDGILNIKKLKIDGEGYKNSIIKGLIKLCQEKSISKIVLEDGKEIIIERNDKKTEEIESEHIPEVLLQNDTDLKAVLGFPERSRVITPNQMIEKNMPIFISGGGVKILFRYTNEYLHIDAIEVAGGLQKRGIGKSIFDNIIKFCQSQNIPEIKLRDGNNDMVWIKFGLSVSDNENIASNIALKYLLDSNFASEHPNFKQIQSYIDKLTKENGINRDKLKSLQDFLKIENGKYLYNEIKREFKKREIWGETAGKPELEFDVTNFPEEISFLSDIPHDI